MVTLSPLVKARSKQELSPVTVVIFPAEVPNPPAGVQSCADKRGIAQKQEKKMAKAIASLLIEFCDISTKI
jgi:hypothetical protein